jgi:hypothetical protein
MLARPAYKRSSQRDTFNSNDGIFQQGGPQLLLSPAGGARGLAAAFAIGLDLSDTAVGTADGRRGGGPRGRGPGGRRGGV